MPDERKEKKRKSFWVSFLYGMIPLTILLGIALIYDFDGKQKLSQALDDAAQDGYPLTMEELEKSRRVWPDEENGALVILSLEPRINMLLDDKELQKEIPLFGDPDLPPLGRRMPEKTDRVVASFLEEVSPELAKIDTLINYEGGRFPIELTPNPIDILDNLEHLSICRQVVKLKSLQTTHQAMHGRTDTLVNNLKVINKHTDLLEDEYTLISQLSCIGFDELTVSIIEHALAHAVINPQQISQIEQLLTTIHNKNHLYTGFVSERAYSMDMFNWLMTHKSQDADGETNYPSVKYVLGLRGFFIRNQVYTLNILNKQVRAAKDPQKGLRRMRKIEEEIDNTPRHYLIARILTHSLTRSFELCLRAKARISSARTALAIERYRLINKTFPENLDQLVPDYLEQIPLDPFDSKPLRYRVDSDAVIVYSIAEDGMDNSGDVEHRTKNENPTDWGFVLLDPAYRNLPPVENLTTSQATQPIP